MTITKTGPDFTARFSQSQMTEVIEAISDRWVELKTLAKSQAEPTPNLQNKIAMLRDMLDDGRAWQLRTR